MLKFKRAKKGVVLTDTCVGMALAAMVITATIFSTGEFDGMKSKAENAALLSAYTIDVTERLQKALDTDGALEGSYQYTEELDNATVKVFVTTDKIETFDQTSAYNVEIELVTKNRAVIDSALLVENNAGAVFA